MTDCDQTKRAIAAAFDEGTAMPLPVQAHVAACAACAAYRHELEALDKALLALGPVPAPANLVARTQARVAREGAGRSRRVVGIAAVLAAAAVITGWLYPVNVSPNALLADLEDMIGGGSGVTFGDFAAEIMRMFESGTVVLLTALPTVSATTLGVTLIGACIFLAAFNGIEATVQRREKR